MITVYCWRICQIPSCQQWHHLLALSHLSSLSTVENTESKRSINENSFLYIFFLPIKVLVYPIAKKTLPWMLCYVMLFSSVKEKNLSSLSAVENCHCSIITNVVIFLTSVTSKTYLLPFSTLWSPKYLSSVLVLWTDSFLHVPRHEIHL